MDWSLSWFVSIVHIIIKVTSLHASFIFYCSIAYLGCKSLLTWVTCAMCFKFLAHSVNVSENHSIHAYIYYKCICSLVVTILCLSPLLKLYVLFSCLIAFMLSRLSILAVFAVTSSSLWQNLNTRPFDLVLFEVFLYLTLGCYFLLYFLIVDWKTWVFYDWSKILNVSNNWMCLI